MALFKQNGVKVTSSEKRNIPEGVWVKCDKCGATLYRKELERRLSICPHCSYHFRFTAQGYIDLFLEPEGRTEHDTKIRSADPLEFKDSLKYSDRIEKYIKKSGLNDAIHCLTGRMDGRSVELAVMDFGFMGGSVGSVVGEKLTRAVNRAVQAECPLVTVSCSGGMRMQEGLYSLMQMAKVSAALVKLSRARLPFISVLTNPTTGGTTASYAMLGDMNISEPGALIGFAGPRVIKQTIGQDLPEGFQSAEFVLEHGFLDMIVPRPELRPTITRLLGILMG